MCLQVSFGLLEVMKLVILVTREHKLWMLPPPSFWNSDTPVNTSSAPFATVTLAVEFRPLSGGGLLKVVEPWSL